MSIFCHQSGVEYPSCPPLLPIPTHETQPEVSEATASTGLRSRPYYVLFPILCKFWCILNGVAVAYYSNAPGEIRDRVAFEFAEFKFRELLAWADRLPSSLARTEQTSHLVVTIQ